MAMMNEKDAKTDRSVTSDMSGPNRKALRIAAIYAACGFLWIALSDRMLASFIRDSALLTEFQTFKGWFFICVTAALVFFLTRRALRDSADLAEDIRSSEERYRTLFEKAGDHVFVLELGEDNDPVIVDANDAALRSHGYIRDELIGKRMSFLDPDMRSDIAAERVRSLRQDGTGTITARHRRKDGTVLDVEAVVQPIRIGHRRLILSVERDVTERRRSEEAIRASEEKFRRLYNETPILLHSIDRSGTVVDVNDYWLRTMGYERDQVLGRKVTDFYTAASKKYAEETVQPDFFREGIVKDVSYQFVRKNGSIIDVLLSATAERDADGSIIRSRAVIEDITERKRAEQEQQESEKRYRILFESANDGIFIQDDTGFIDCNQRGADMYGLPKEQVIGRSPGAFAPERQPDGRLSRDVAEEKVRSAMTGAPQVFAWQPVRADGSPFDVEITLNRLDVGGKTYLMAVVRDITERKRLEQELLKTQKLESLGVLAGGIAHDFNNLLQGIFGYISMAKITHHQREKSLSMLEQAENSLHQAVSLTSQLLTFSKGGKPAKKIISLRTVIENAARLALSGSRVLCDITIPDDLRRVDADAGQIGQVIQNIVLNAEQSMPLGGRITISANNVPATGVPGPGAAAGDFVEVLISDHGIGIPADHLERIFDPYFTTKDKGSGLGLATSYSIIKNHGGIITAASQLGQGSCFGIYLPASCAVETPSALTQTRGTLRKLRVLVMDDDEVVRNVAREILGELGHTVETAPHGAAAVEMYREAKARGSAFDVVILDLTVRGGMGGVETLRKLREIDPAVKAVVSSGYSDDTAVSSYREMGFQTFLNKPYTIEGLRDVLGGLAC